LGKIAENCDHNIGIFEKRQFFAEIWEKSPKIVIITSTPAPGNPVMLEQNFFFLLQEEELRLVDDGAGKGDPSLLPLAQLMDSNVRLFADSEGVQQDVDGLFPFRIPDPVNPAVVVENFFAAGTDFINPNEFAD
jgi:hypothetical protein